VDAIKRTCIKKPPNHLIVNLKRFEFDLQTLTKHKLNDRFEFPLSLNLEPYCYDYIQSSDKSTNANSAQGDVASNNGINNDVGASDRDNADQYEYQLAGIISHTGSIDSGHYFSFVRERKPRFPNVGGEW